MKLNKKICHAIKQSNGTLWIFSYDENLGITYKILKENQSISCNSFIKNCKNNFSIILYPNDHIYLIYQELNGTIMMNIYNGVDWTVQEILENDESDTFNVFLKAILHNNKINIFYNILNKKTNNRTLFYQVLDEEIKLSEQKLIDVINFNCSESFDVYSQDNKNLYIIYEKQEENYQIGYRILYNNKTWSEFFIIDTSSYPFNDYSVLIVENNLCALYIKKEDNMNNLIYSCGNNPKNLKSNILLKAENIEGCSLLIFCGLICFKWIKDGKIYSSFSINDGRTFSIHPYRELLKSDDIIIVKYKSNVFTEINDLFMNEIYITNENIFKYLIISDISLYIRHFLKELYVQNQSYENTIKQQEQLLIEFKYKLEEQKAKLSSYENKLKDINDTNTKFKDEKNSLIDSIILLQDKSIEREETLNQLERCTIEKEDEINSLKLEISERENKIITLENISTEEENKISSMQKEISNQQIIITSLNDKIQNLTDQIINLKSQLDEVNFKINNTFFNRIFKTNNT